MSTSINPFGGSRTRPNVSQAFRKSYLNRFDVFIGSNIRTVTASCHSFSPSLRLVQLSLLPRQQNQCPLSLPSLFRLHHFANSSSSLALHATSLCFHLLPAASRPSSRRSFSSKLLSFIGFPRRDVTACSHTDGTAIPAQLGPSNKGFCPQTWRVVSCVGWINNSLLP